MSKITLKDIAREANVSVGLTSKALAGYHEVSTATQQRIRRISRQLGYRPPTRRGLHEAAVTRQAGSSLKRACLVFLDSNNSATIYAQHWMRAFAQASREQDIRLEMAVIEPRAEDMAWEAQLRRAAQDVDGLLLFGFMRSAAREVVANLGKHCVGIGDFEPGPAPLEHQVNFDKRDMASIATRTLLEAGHRRVGLIAKASSPGSWNEQWRLGYRMAMMQAGLDDDPSLRPVLDSNDRSVCGVIAARSIAAMDDRPTAYVIPEISMAVHFRHAMAQQGMNLSPGQMIVGGDPELAVQAGLGGHPLISEDVSAAAVHAVDLLHRLARDEDVPPIRVMVASQTHHFNLVRRDMACSSHHDSDVSVNARMLASRRSR